jgi:hypothetical protein
MTNRTFLPRATIHSELSNTRDPVRRRQLDAEVLGVQACGALQGLVRLRALPNAPAVGNEKGSQITRTRSLDPCLPQRSMLHLDETRVRLEVVA